ncbi:COG1615 family transporter, partial [Micromonospora aurantiaca]|nr:COG1615 family transporter [Micromonospora aurantiaca]
SPPARAHLSVLFGVFILLKAVAYWFDRYGLVHSERGVTTGASYTDVNALLPAKTILFVIALLCAAMFFSNLLRRGMMLPGVGF